jgi:Helicase conserved C-terminal domain
MSKGSLTILPDRSLTVEKHPGEDTAAMEAALSAFVELGPATETQSHYQITAASIWRARRQGLSLAEILHTLETYSQSEIPAKVRADLAMWSTQIDRLTLEVDQGRLVLRSHNPLALTAVLHHHTLRTFITYQIDATTLEVRADTYPEVVHAFDAAQHPVLDRVPQGRNLLVSPPGTSHRRDRGAGKRAARRAPAVASPTVASPTAGSEARRRLVAEFDVLRGQLPRRCQALTKASRQCKNWARPPSAFCRVHADRAPRQDPLEAFPHRAHLAGYVLDQMLAAGLLTLAQFAVIRMGIVVGSGLCSWFLYELLRGVGRGWQLQPLAAWSTASLAFVLTCWLLGRLVGGSGFVAGLRILLFLLLSLLADCLHKEGLLLNLCFVLLPVGLPAAMLYRYGLSWWWGLLLFPLGLALGKLFYNLAFQEQSPENLR